MSLDDHSHCYTCSLVKCSEGCPIVSCPHDCGALYHWCKTDEHVLVCYNAKVPCINQSYGCPREMPRHQLGAHLAVCPASVVCCPCEWNRWPLYAQERNQSVPFKRTNFHAISGQLDVALALRDQRILVNSMKFPRNLRNSLKDNLNHRSPAVPLLVSPNSEQVSLKTSLLDGEAAETWHYADGHDPGENPGTSSRNSEALAETTEKSSTTSDDMNQTEQLRQTANKANDEPAGKTAQEQEDVDRKHCDINMNQSMMISGEIPHPPAPPFSLYQTMSLDLNVESITRYQAKPRSMYTFLCLQVFRRDQYPWHVKNMHAEIYSGLNGWLLQRCPLATYGCTYSATRLRPNTRGTKIVYSSVLESFGLQPGHSCSQDDKELSPDNGPEGGEDYLSELPVELLERITDYLDGFSLNNLALTSYVLQNVCFSILKKRGIVLLQWQKDKTEKKIKWIADGMLWMFPNSVTPIEKWVPDDLFSMSTHLKNCPYNKPREMSTERVKVMLPSDIVVKGEEEGTSPPEEHTTIQRSQSSESTEQN